MPAIAVVTHRSRRWIERLIGGAVATAEQLEVPLIAVDNASDDGTLELLQELGRRSPSVELVTLGRNLGYAAAVNAAFAAAADRDVMVINPDVELLGPEPVTGLAGFLAERPDVGVVGPRLVGDDGEAQASARRFPTPAAVAASMTSAGRLGPLRSSRARYEAPSAASEPASVDWVMGAAMLIRRRAYEAARGWDAGYFLYVEDADFCRRVRRAGWDVVYHPGVELPHAYARESSSAEASVVSSLARRRHFRSFARFWAKDPMALIGRSRARAR